MYRGSTYCIYMCVVILGHTWREILYLKACAGEFSYQRVHTITLSCCHYFSSLFFAIAGEVMGHSSDRLAAAWGVTREEQVREEYEHEAHPNQ